MRNPTAVFYYPKRKSYKYIGGRFFSEMHSEKKRASGHKLQQDEFSSDTGKKNQTV